MSGQDEIDHAVIREPQGSTRTRVVGVLQSRVAVVQDFSIPSWTFNVLSVIESSWLRFALLKIHLNDEQGV